MTATREDVVSVVGKLRLITVSRDTTYGTEWRVRVYDGSLAVYETHAATDDVAHEKAVEWIYENYDVIVSVELA